MEWSAFGAIAGFAIQVVAAGVAMIWPDQKWIGWLVFGFGLSVMLLAGGVFSYLRWSSVKIAPKQVAFLIVLGFLTCAPFVVILLIMKSGSQNATKAEARIQFFGDRREPIGVYMDNIWRWQTHYSSEIDITSKDKHGNTIPNAGFTVPRNWIVTIVFDKPVSLKQIAVRFSGSTNIHYSIDHVDERMAQVSIEQDVPPGELDIYTLN